MSTATGKAGLPLVAGYSQFGGRCPEAAALCNLLAARGVMAPHTGKPFSEAFVLGLGSGISAGYFSFQYGPETSVFIGTRGLWYKVNGEFSQTIVKRLGSETIIRETTSSKAALQNLTLPIAAGEPVMVWVDKASMPYHSLPASLKRYVYHTAVVCGFDEAPGLFLVDDTAPAPWAVSKEDLIEARSTIRSQKNRTLTVTPAKRVPDLRGAVCDAIRECRKEMLEPGGSNFGLPALKKWAALMTSARDKKGWPSLFPPGPGMYRALTSVHQNIESAGRGTAAFRSMYAEFLNEAAEVLSRAELRKIAVRYEQLAGLWSTLAEAALPTAVPALHEAREQHNRKLQLMREKGPAAQKEIREAGERLLALDREHGAELEKVKPEAPFPLNMEETASLLHTLQDQVLLISREEEAALEALIEALPKER